MALQEALQHIFNNDYQGTEAFINEVIIPVFGNDIHRINLDYAQDDEYREKAQKAGIQNLIHVALISDERYNSNDIEFFDVTLKDNVNVERARVNIQQLIRSIVARFSHILIVFHYKDVANRPWRFSYAYKQSTITSTTSAKRYTYVFGRDFRGRTAAERFEELKDSQHTDEDFEKAFSVQALSDEFFDRYRAYYAVFVEYITGEKYSDESKLTNIIRRWDWKASDSSNQFETTFERDAKATRDYIKKMFGRIVFLYFLQRKGWLYNDEGQSDSLYMHHLFEKANRMELADRFLDDVLEILFFYILNTEKHEDRIKFAELERGKDVTLIPGWDKIPFLNGGLFQDDEIDRKPCVFPATYFKELFNFLDSYNFTIDENDPEDAEIGIDPEMLGRIFENLLEDNKDKGAYYTPKPIVDYMCRESIIAYLQNEKFSEEGNLKIRTFVETFNRDDLSAKQREYLRDKLKEVKICDPAIGSGAFPMGLVNLLAKLYISLGINSNELSNIKRHIMQNNIYGVDIESGAVDIARLRFWLAMVVDEPVAIPLPNLHFKIMQGNSLLEFFNGEDLSDLTKLKEQRQEGESRGLFDADEAERVNLISLLSDFYSESNHNKSARLFNDIINNVRRQLLEKNIILPEGLDPSANSEFFLWHTWFKDVFDNGGFDIVIGNPPYLKEGRASKDIFAPLKRSPYYKGKMDIWYMFACQGIDMLKPGGNLCFIATNNWITSAGAQKLRNKITSDATIIQMCDFRNFMIFESASIQTMIMQFKKDNSKENYSFDCRNLLGSSLKDVIMLLQKEYDVSTQFLSPVFSRNSMRDQYFTFSQSEGLLNKIQKNQKVIFLNDEEITQGIVPNPDIVNSRNIKKIHPEVISKYEINVGDPVFITPKGFFKTLTSLEESVIKPVFEPTDLFKYKIEASSSDIIYLTKTNSKNKEDFPNLISHLEKYREIMYDRRETQNGRLAYYQLHWPRAEAVFMEGEKILSPRKCLSPLFCYTQQEAYVMMSINVIITKRVKMKYLAMLLNSKLIRFWLKNKGKMQGANYQIDKEPLQQIPIALSSQKIQDLISSQYDKIIVLPDSAKCTIIENEIDHLVYHLYDLTYDEVLVIDPETPITREEYEKYNF